MSQHLLKISEDDMKVLAEDLAERWEDYDTRLIQQELEVLAVLVYRLGWFQGLGFANNEHQGDIEYYEQKLKAKDAGVEK